MNTRLYVQTEPSGWQHWTNSAYFDSTGNIIEYQAVVRDITDSKTGNNLILDDLNKKQGLLDFAGVMFIAIDRDGNVIHANKKACEVLEYSGDEIIGKNWFDKFIPEKIREGIRQVFKELMAGNEKPMELVENKVLTNTEKEKLIRWHNSIIKNKDGIIIGTLSSGQDISAQRKIEAQKKIFEDRYKLLSENVNDVIWIIDLGLNPIYVSPSIEKLTGYSAEEIIKFPVFDLVVPESLKTAENYYKGILNSIEEDGIENVQPFTVELEYIRKDRSKVWTESYASIIKTEDGKPYACVGVTRDISERKKSEQIILDSEKTFKSIIENTLFGVYIFQENKLVFSNDALLKMIGYTFDEIENLSFNELLNIVDADDRKMVGQYHNERESGNRDFRIYEIQINSKDKMKKCLKLFSVAISYHRKPAVQVFVEDITEKKQAEENLDFQMNLEQLLIDISTGFINVELNEFDKEIHEALSKIGKFAQLERCCVFEFSEDNRFLSNTYEWHGAGIESNVEKFQNLDVMKSKLDLIGLKNDEVISIDSVEEMKPELKNDQKFLMEKGIKSIAFIPIKVRGDLIGIFSFDSSKNKITWSKEIAQILKGMGSILGNVFDRIKVDKELREINERYQSLYYRSLDAIFIYDLEGKFIDANDAALSLTGYTRDDIVQINLIDVLGADQLNRAIELKGEILKTGTQKEIAEFKIKRKDGAYIWLESMSFLLCKNNEPYAIQGIARDITDRKEFNEKIKISLQEKEVLLKEIHHRVKNNMQIISSMINLTLSSNDNPEIESASQNIIGRIRSMGLIHEMMYQSENLQVIDFHEYVHNLINEISSTISFNKQIEFNVDVGDIHLNIDIAIPCAIIIYELVTNALKHAFIGKRNGSIWITLNEKKNNNYNYYLIIKDDGIGSDIKLNLISSNSLGFDLVTSLVKQLNGNIKIKNEHGVSCIINF